MPSISWRGCWDTCSLPLIFDSYQSCSFGCEYCYAKESHKKSEVVPYPLKILQKMKRVGLQDNNGRAQKYKWGYDNITVRLGYLTDPLPYVEGKYKTTLAFMKEFENRSLVIITKNPKGLTDEHLEVSKSIKDFAIQVSFSSESGKHELNAPSVSERLNIIENLAAKGVLVGARLQPTTSKLISDSFINKLIDAGVYGISLAYPEFESKNMKDFDYDYNEELQWHKHIAELVKNKCDLHCSPYDERHIGNNPYTCLPKHFRRWSCTHYEPTPSCPIDVKIKRSWRSEYKGEPCGEVLEKRRMRWKKLTGYDENWDSDDNKYENDETKVYY